MAIQAREEQCQHCIYGQRTHEQDEIHEVCEAGTCILCFQSGKIDCFDFELNEPIQKESH